MPSDQRLTAQFYDQPTLDVAQQLLGKTLYCAGRAGVITETEAYLGQADPAAHSYRGLTARNAAMFGPAGNSYVYFIYGLHYCFNVVTEPAGVGHAVLVRGIKPVTPAGQRLNGPAKVTQFFGINLQHNALNLITHPDFYLTNTPCVGTVMVTPRIGITQGRDFPWRFVLID